MRRFQSLKTLLTFSRGPGHRRKVALADLMADQNPPCASIFAEILCELEERARCFYSQKAVGGHGFVGFP